MSVAPLEGTPGDVPVADNPPIGLFPGWSLEAARLRDDWPKLCPLLSGPTRRACERKLGLREAGLRAT
jgi:hypothetical protein